MDTITYDAITHDGDYVREYCTLPRVMGLDDAIDFVMAQPENNDIRYYRHFYPGTKHD